MAMAMLASVTVSIGEDTKGVFMVICLVSAEVRSWRKNMNAFTQLIKESRKPELGILTQNPQLVTQLTILIITDSDWFNYTIAAEI